MGIKDDWHRSPAGILGGKPDAKYLIWHAVGTEEKRILAMANNEMDILAIFHQRRGTFLDQKVSMRRLGRTISLGLIWMILVQEVLFSTMKSHLMISGK